MIIATLWRDILLYFWFWTTLVRHLKTARRVLRYFTGNRRTSRLSTRARVASSDKAEMSFNNQ